MKDLRIPIAGLMAFVLFIAVGLAGFRSGSETWFRSLYTMTVSALLLSSLAAKVSREPASAFWFGFASCGWCFLLLGFGLTPKAQPDFEDLDNEPMVNSFLTTTTLIKKAFILTSHYSNVKQIGKYGFSIGIGHLVATLLLAGIGGSFAFVLTKRGLPEANAGPTAPMNCGPRSTGNTRLIWILAVSAIFIPASIPLVASSNGPYFPDMVLCNQRESDVYLNGLYSGYLGAIGEPSLWRPSSGYRNAEVYRFLRLHALQHPMCVRIERRGESVILRFVVLDGVRDDGPSVIAVDRQRKLTLDQWDELVRRVVKSGFWSLGKDKDVVDLLDVDRDVVEGLKDGQHHVIERYSQNRYECSDLWDYMLELTGFQTQ